MWSICRTVTFLEAPVLTVHSATQVREVLRRRSALTDLKLHWYQVLKRHEKLVPEAERRPLYVLHLQSVPDRILYAVRKGVIG